MLGRLSQNVQTLATFVNFLRNNLRYAVKQNCFEKIKIPKYFTLKKKHDHESYERHYQKKLHYNFSSYYLCYQMLTKQLLLELSRNFQQNLFNSNVSKDILNYSQFKNVKY